MTTDFKTELERSGHVVFTNKGISMMPLLRQDRDIMVIDKGLPPYRKNDAVLFIRDSGSYVLHRITKILPDGMYEITGDNCTESEKVREDQIIGVLSEVRRDGKTIKTGDTGYRIYVFTRPFARFLKRIYHKGRSCVAKMYRKVFKI